MATEAVEQVGASSIDRRGLSVATSSPNVRSPRAGTSYDVAHLAAAVPVWFHPMPDGRYLALYSRRLTQASPGSYDGAGIQLYGGTTVDDGPCWAPVDPATGARGAVVPIPSRKAGTRTLTAAATRGDFLFTLSIHRSSPTAAPRALLQNFRVTARDNIILEDEEFVPGNLGLGLFCDRSHVWVFGDDGKGRLTLARKNWGRIGTQADPNATRNWQFRGLNGWYSDPKKMRPMPGPNDGTLPAAGPCSVGVLRDRYYLAATGMVPGTPAVPPTPVPVKRDLFTVLNGIVDQITAVINGVANGFLGAVGGSVTVITNLLAQAVQVVTGGTANKDSAVTALVQQFLGALTGVGQVITDPAALLNQIMGAITGLPVVGGLVTAAQDFLGKVVTSALGLASTIVGPKPVALLIHIIKSLTGIDLTDPNADHGTDGETGGTPAVPARWFSRFYTTRRVDELWSTTKVPDVPLGDEDTYLGGGLQLQPQLPLSRGFAHTVTSNGVTVMRPSSHHIQVFTGSAPQTVVLPAAAKVAGTIMEVDGSVTIPDTSLPQLSIADASVSEGNAGTVVMRFTVTSTLSPDVPITVDWATTAGTAAAGEDYTAANGTLTIDGGTTSQQVSVTVVGDTKVEPDERFTITLSRPYNARIARATATGTIVNDDTAAGLNGLLSDLQNILNGVISGAIKVGSAIATAVASILEQATRTITGVVGDTGGLVIGLVSDFLEAISGGALSIPGAPDPGAALASIIDRITGGAGAVGQDLADLATNLFTAVTGTVSGALTGAIDFFHDLINGITGIFSLQVPAGAPALMSLPGDPPDAAANRIAYMPYTLHNQSTADLTVVSSDRRGPSVKVPHGVGTVFTPYSSEPTAITNWSWSQSSERAPKARAGFPWVSTVGIGTTDGGTGPSDHTWRTRWGHFDPAYSPPPLEAGSTGPAPPPTATAAEPDLLRELIRRFTTIAAAVAAGTLQVGGGPVATITQTLLGAVTAMTGQEATDADGSVAKLATEFLQGLATGGAGQGTAASFENLIRQITGGTGLTGGLVQGTVVPTPLDFVQQALDAAGDLVGGALQELADLFATVVNAITGNQPTGV